jgi:ribosomal protein S18 acetylase RimI-like enzyme
MIYRKNPPVIPGLKFRHFEGESDYPKIAAVIAASEKADHSQREVDADDIANAYQHMSNCDPYRDVIFAEVSGEVVGYTRGWWSDESAPERMYIHNGFLIPEWRRKGIGHSMLLWMEQRLREIAATHPPEMVKLYQVNVSQFQKDTAIMLERSGYQSVRYFYLMVRPTLDDIPQFPLPAGLEIRPVSPEHYRLIWELNAETGQDEWGHKKPTEDDYQEWLVSYYFQPDLWQVAWDIATNQVIGQVLTYIYHDENKQFNRKRGHTEGIGVARSWRKRGVASALISQSLLAQKAAGMTESALVVDSDNPSGATHLYESCGFQIIKRDTLYRKPLVL